MRLLYGHDDDVADFIASQIPQVREHGFGDCRAIGVIDKTGLLIGGMAFHHWWPEAGTIEFSGAATTPKWMTRRILSDLFGYAFAIPGIQMLVTRNSASNTRLHRQLATYGFDRFDIPRLFGRDDDGVIWTLTKEQFEGGRFRVRAFQANGGEH